MIKFIYGKITCIFIRIYIARQQAKIDNLKKKIEYLRKENESYDVRYNNEKQF